MSASALTMLARISLAALAVLCAGCLKDLSQVDSSTGDPTTTTDGPATESTTPPTSTTDTKPSCGDGTRDPGEQCDDGNAVDGDGCEADCTTTPGEMCGNGVVDDGEECDDGNKANGDGCENNCTETVISPTCGDGVQDAEGEECDDGNRDNNDACTNACKSAYCGDGIQQTGVEACDDGGFSPTCDDDCTAPMCGDGLVNPDAGEQCEDGNADDSDACLVTCKQATCGDGIVQVGVEECDDGTPDGDDLCNACTVTPHRYIFITANTFSGDLNGVAGADAQCLFAANDADIPGAGDTGWVAWLSMNTNQASQRLDTAFTGWYVLPTDPPTLVAKGWAGLTSGTLMHAIDHTESGQQVEMPALAWTNTDITGMIPVTNLHCKNWNSDGGADMGRVGQPAATNGDWTDPANPLSVACDTAQHLYCIQDVP